MMIGINFDAELVKSLTKNSVDRCQEDIHVIYSFLRQLDSFSRLADQPLRAICRNARYERHRANEILFRKNQISTCWYILLNGSVFIDGHMYLPRDNFGKRTGNSSRRNNDCLVLEPSDMIVIDYPDMAVNSTDNNRPRRAITSMNLDHVTLPMTAIATSKSSFGQNAFNRNRSSKKPDVSPMMSSIHDEAPSSSSTSEQLREIETVIHRSEVYLAHQYHHDGRNAAVNRGAPPTNGSNVVVGSSGIIGGTPSTSSHRSSARSSSSSGAYSGSDKLPSTSTVECDDELADLPEGNVDSDEEDDESCPSGDSFMELRDNVRECLEKEPNERTEEDIHVLLDFMQHMPAFANLPVRVKRELCWKMVFAVVEKAFTTVMRDGEQLDSWSVIVNGEVEIIMPDGKKMELHLGDCFGVDARPESQYHVGQMRTVVDDCQFVLVAQNDYVQTMSKVSDNLRKHTDSAGEIVSETEKRTLENNREGYVLIKGKPDKLVQALIEERDTNVDQYYVEDFLLMYRTFIKNPMDIFNKFLCWFVEPALREKVARLVLLWVNNHFNDFETESQMMRALEHFEQALEREDMTNHQQLLNIACSVKSRCRTVTYTRSNRDEILHFSILGGNDNCNGIFVSKVESNSHAEKVGLKRGDQILEVNNNNFQHISHQKALELLRGSTHLSITVKSNLLGFKEMLAADRNERQPSTTSLSTNGGSGGLVPGAAHQRPKSAASSVSKRILLNADGRPVPPPLLHHTHSYIDAQALGGARSSMPTSPVTKPIEKETSRLGKLIKKIKHGNSASSLQSDEDKIDSGSCGEVNFNPDVTDGSNGTVGGGHLRLKHSRSNPDISNNHLLSGISQYYQPVRSPCPEHVLKIYRGDQSFKFLTVYKETTAQNVVQLALQEFGMAAVDVSSMEWSLCEVSVSPEGVMKQRRLPDQMQNLAERIALNSRYYLKSNKTTESLVPDDLAHDLLKESQTNLLQMSAQILAAQLTLQDFAVFAAIEPTEYVDNLFELKSKYGWPKLGQFEELVNREMWWVATEIVREKAVIRRAKIIKKFIKIARQCRDFKNFNSMFAIMSGLEKPSVRRLHCSWDKVPSKYVKMFEDLQLLLDPSRNMSKYRQHLIQMSLDPPVIPLFPVVRKDLFFIHHCNPTLSDGLVNFEKLRMIAKEIRTVTKLASAPYDLTSMFEQTNGAGRLNDALLHMNTFDGGATVATMRKQFLQRGPLSRKKLYEQALMVRRCKSYLTNLVIIDAESELDKMSLDCEPQASGGSANSINSRRRLPSPSPSSSSSMSAASDNNRRFMAPKFGVESPQAVQRMLALVDHSRLRSATQRSGTSPVTSPCPPRRGHKTQNASIPNCQSHGRSYSESIAPSVVPPVDLTAESSSVTTLLSPMRLHSSGSVTSTDSAISQQSVASVNISHAISCDSTDSGHGSMDTQSASPPNQRRSFPLNHNRYKVQHYPASTSMTTTTASAAAVSSSATGSSSVQPHRKPHAQETAELEVQSQGIRRTNSIPSSSRGSHYRHDGEQVSRV